MLARGLQSQRRRKARAGSKVKERSFRGGFSSIVLLGFSPLLITLFIVSVSGHKVQDKMLYQSIEQNL
jgi:hypothetical protein